MATEVQKWVVKLSFSIGFIIFVSAHKIRNSLAKNVTQISLYISCLGTADFFRWNIAGKRRFLAFHQCKNYVRTVYKSY